MTNKEQSADHLLSIRFYPGLDYGAFPRSVDEWLDAACTNDTGNIECVAPFLRPYVSADLLTPEGWFKQPCDVFNTPLKYALWQLAFDTDANFPWKGTGIGPKQARTWWEAYKAEQAPAEAPEPAGVSDLYFIGSDHGPIKIGVSIHPEKRLKSIQTSHPYPLKILALIPKAGLREIEYHERFAEHRLAGEWFDRHPDILAEIDRLSPLPHRPGSAI